jgi:hypothetical protein
VAVTHLESLSLNYRKPKPIPKGHADVTPRGAKNVVQTCQINIMNRKPSEHHSQDTNPPIFTPSRQYPDTPVGMVKSTRKDGKPAPTLTADGLGSLTVCLWGARLPNPRYTCMLHCCDHCSTEPSFSLPLFCCSPPTLLLSLDSRWHGCGMSSLRDHSPRKGRRPS